MQLMWRLLLTLTTSFTRSYSKPIESSGHLARRWMVPENVTSSPLVAKPVIIGHRGASGMFPEHTATAYQAAIEQGADFIECDVMLTKDNIPVCLHDPWLHQNTDIQHHPDLSHLKTTYKYNNKEITSWFIWDLTWRQVQSLRTVQARPERDKSYDGKFPVCSLENYLLIAQNAPRPVGIYPELKSPDIFNKILSEAGSNTTVEAILVSMLSRFGYNSPSSPAFIQSFHIQSLAAVSSLTPLPLVYLVEDSSALVHISCYAMFLKGVGIWKNQAVVVDEVSNRIASFTSVVTDLHALGLLVHVYTFRNEFPYLAFDYGQDPAEEIEVFKQIGIDGYFTDFPSTVYKYISRLDCT